MTLNESLHKLTGLVGYDFESIIANATAEEKKKLYAKISWFIPRGARLLNADEQKMVAEALNDLADSAGVDADVNSDAVIDDTDVEIVDANIGKEITQENAKADVNNDNKIDDNDKSIVKEQASARKSSVTGVKTAEELIAALGNAKVKTIKLEENIELSDVVDVTHSVALNLNGKVLSSPNKKTLKVINNSTLNVDGTVDGSKVNGTLLAGYSKNNAPDEGNIVINGGVYESAIANYCAIQNNGFCINSNITAKNAKFVSTDDTFYIAGGGNVVLENCEVVGATGMYVKAGKVSLKNCDVKANGQYAEPVTNGNGASSTGDGIIIDAKKGYKQEVDLVLNKTNVSSDNAFVIRETYTDDTKTAVHKIVIGEGVYVNENQETNIHISEYFEQAVDAQTAIFEKPENVTVNTYKNSLGEVLG